MVQPWLLVTPASRGIGFQLARRLLKTTDLPVVATARNKQDETKSKLLEGLDVDEKRLDVLPLDVTGMYGSFPRRICPTTKFNM